MDITIDVEWDHSLGAKRQANTLALDMPADVLRLWSQITLMSLAATTDRRSTYRKHPGLYVPDPRGTHVTNKQRNEWMDGWMVW